MKERVWTFGSLPDCDIRVESPAVSGRHCRLTQRGRTFLIEDLASTNGTFVAGQRIDRPREVRHGEQIMLGQNTPMPWPSLSSITIGRLPDNDVVIPLDMVSGHHARLERQGGSVYLVDLNSSNGTSLNDPLNKIRRAVVRPTDVVFFGTHKIKAAELFAALPEADTDAATSHQATRLESPIPAALIAPRPPDRAPAPPAKTDQFAAFRSPRSWVIGIVVSAVLIVSVVVAKYIYDSRSTNATSPGVSNSTRGDRLEEARKKFLERKAKQSGEKNSQ
jgi:pSer/pThr/pTyr-binding forkhead associated (FHA) protein